MSRQTPVLARRIMTPFRLAVALAAVLPAAPAVGADRPVTFERDVQPVLTRAGCNAGACHGKARGQNGFALSLLGFDPDFDHRAIARDARGRRLSPADPDASLLLLKAAGELPHGGGARLPKGSPGYEVVRRWVAAGCPRTPAGAPALVRVTVEPAQVVAKFRHQQPLAVFAHYSDGAREDVTRLAAFQSNESGYAAVDADGVVRVGSLAGEAAVTARFGDKFAVCTVLVPHPEPVPAAVYDRLPRRTLVDGHVWAKLKQLGLPPSGPAPDSTFHRRAFLGLIGRLPTPDEARAFLADPDPGKREKLIDRLLARPEYADFWANKWADLLRPNPYHVGIKATLNYDAWVRDQFRQNRPYDRFVRDLLAARGSTFQNGAAVFYRNRRDPVELATLVSQLFLGVRLDCARCHQHPSEKWGQRDVYGFAAFFARVGHKGTGISAPISGGEEVVYVRPAGAVTHPLSREVLPPAPLLGRHVERPGPTRGRRWSIG